MFGLFSQRCQQCGNILKRTKYEWKIDGVTKTVCPACNTTLQRRASSASFRDGNTHATGGHKTGGSSCIGTLVLLGVVACAAVGFYASRTKESAAPPPQLVDVPRKPRPPEAQPANTRPAEAQPVDAPTSQASPPKETAPFTLAGAALPATLITTLEVTLLNAAGKEVPIQAGTGIRITERSAGGTLSMTINGATFVGNESRLAGKVKLE